MYKTAEKLKAKVKLNLSNGAKTIISQYHELGTSTLIILIISDTYNKKLENGIANDGIFDISVNYKDIDGKITTLSLGIVKNNDILNYEMENRFGEVRIRINDREVVFKTRTQKRYLKFGGYLQAKDPYTNRQAGRDKYEEFYKKIK